MDNELINVINTEEIPPPTVPEKSIMLDVIEFTIQDYNIPVPEPRELPIIPLEKQYV